MYSQHDEEKLILDAVGGLNAADRTVLDIGAYDGVGKSNSRALIERGWRAFLVEAAVGPFEKLLALYAGNPRVTLLHAAMGPENRIVEFFDYGMEQAGTTIEAQCAKWSGLTPRRYWVPQVTVRTMLAQLGGSADVLTIDTEGSSFEILRDCPVDAWCPAVIVVEHDGRMSEISAWGREKRYKVVAVNGENMVLRPA